MSPKKSLPAAIGLRARTGRAILVVLGGSKDAPCALAKTEISLVDPKLPATAQPYHVVMELPWPEAVRAARKFERAIEKTAIKAISRLIKEQASNGVRICGLGVVGAPERDVARIGNPHIRAHGAEGVLFRRVLHAAAEANGLPWRAFPDQRFEESVAPELDPVVKRQLNELGRTVAPPWRAYEKQAAAAAWLVLHGKGPTLRLAGKDR